ncbi:hypothetical protein [Neisseria musculi]|uniref:hypothetical protein n=1 Tax=Neisseria musculi TaxID=1815583 RepID=UPI001FE41525|nr:hypothetical protein [Neisseria musculi]
MFSVRRRVRGFPAIFCRPIRALSDGLGVKVRPSESAPACLIGTAAPSEVR